MHLQGAVAAAQGDAAFAVPQELDLVVAGLFDVELDQNVFVVTDSEGAISEQNEENNSSASVARIALELPSNDLEVVAIGAPTNALSGLNLMLSCIVTNNGRDSIPNTSWRDAFYLSADQTLGTNDIFLGEVTSSLALPGGGSYSNTLSFRLPVVEKSDRSAVLAASGAMPSVAITVTRPELGRAGTAISRLRSESSVRPPTLGAIGRSEAVAEPATTSARRSPRTTGRRTKCAR
jgi:hypothetical protein